MKGKAYLPALGAVVLGAAILALAVFAFRGLAQTNAQQEPQAVR